MPSSFNIFPVGNKATPLELESQGVCTLLIVLTVGDIPVIFSGKKGLTPLEIDIKRGFRSSLIPLLPVLQPQLQKRSFDKINSSGAALVCSSGTRTGIWQRTIRVGQV